jgi:hypothetical protein
MIPQLIGAGIGAILPVVMEAFRDKPDPEQAKALIESKRQEMIDYEIGGGKSMDRAKKDVDARIQAEFAQAEKEGQFNTPWGEMFMGAVLGAIAPAAGKFAKGLVTGGGKAATGATGTAAAPAAVAAAESVAAPVAKEAAKSVAKRASRSVSRPFPGAVTAKELDPLMAQSELLGRMQPSAAVLRGARQQVGLTGPYPLPTAAPEFMI